MRELRLSQADTNKFEDPRNWCIGQRMWCCKKKKKKTRNSLEESVLQTSYTWLYHIATLVRIETFSSTPFREKAGHCHCFYFGRSFILPRDVVRKRVKCDVCATYARCTRKAKHGGRCTVNNTYIKPTKIFKNWQSVTCLGVDVSGSRS